MNDADKAIVTMIVSGIVGAVCLIALGVISAANTEANVVAAIKAGASPLEASCAIDTAHSDLCRILVAKKSSN